MILTTIIGSFVAGAVIGAVAVVRAAKTHQDELSQLHIDALTRLAEQKRASAQRSAELASEAAHARRVLADARNDRQRFAETRSGHSPTPQGESL